MITALGVIIAWVVYRKSIVAKRKSYLIALGELLEIVGLWFGSSYPLDMENEGWKNPDYTVHKVDVGIVNAILNDGGYIFGEAIIKKLVQFVELVARFNQFIDAHTSFVISHYGELNEAGDNIFKKKVYALMKNIHVIGIGSQTYHDNPTDYPFLNKCFSELKIDIEKEKNKNVNLLYWNNFFVLDFLFILIPIFYIAWNFFAIFQKMQ